MREEAKKYFLIHRKYTIDAAKSGDRGDHVAAMQHEKIAMQHKIEADVLNGKAVSCILEYHTLKHNNPGKRIITILIINSYNKFFNHYRSV